MKYLVYIVIAFILFLIIRKIVGRIFPKLKSAKSIISGVIAIGLVPITAKLMFILFFNIILFEYHPNRNFKSDSCLNTGGHPDLLLGIKSGLIE